MSAVRWPRVLITALVGTVIVSLLAVTLWWR